jgi:hypothetical protein
MEMKMGECCAPSIKPEMEVCKNCSNDKFELLYKIAKISALVSQKGVDEYHPIPFFVCSKCGSEVGLMPEGYEE